MMVTAEPMPPERWRRRVFPWVTAPQFHRDKRSIAYHEAGHAIIMETIGMPIRRIAAEATRGEVTIDVAAVRRAPDLTPSDDFKERAACELAAMYCAGLQAELLLVGLRVEGAVQLDDSDHRNAALILRETIGTIRPLGYAQLLARHFLSHSWPEVQHLAQHLLIHGSMDIA